jgi:hypothetical protein
LLLKRIYSSGVATAGHLGKMPQLKIWPFKYYFLEVFPIKLKKIEICQPIL